jgi:GntR family transcriptional regulator, transcriptional repressor for pyruvate dehydrogenase complex
MIMTNWTVAQRNTLAENTADQIRSLIFTGELKPGQVLPTRDELGSRFGVGRSTINEAIQILASVGLVDSRPGKGTWVRDDAVEEMIHPDAVRAHLGSIDARMLFDARTLIEVDLTAKAAANATEQECRAIWAALAKMEETLADDAAFLEADLSFHMLVANAAHNSLLAAFYRLCRRLLTEVISDLIKLPSVKQDALALQRAIASAIAQHDSEGARAAALAHMRNLAPAFGKEAEQAVDDQLARLHQHNAA